MGERQWLGASDECVGVVHKMFFDYRSGQTRKGVPVALRKGLRIFNSESLLVKFSHTLNIIKLGWVLGAHNYFKQFNPVFVSQYGPSHGTFLLFLHSIFLELLHILPHSNSRLQFFPYIAKMVVDI